MDRIKVSACIVTYNNYEKCLKTISSLYKYTKGVDFTLFISDNSDSDRTAQEIARHFPQAVIIKNIGNKGFGFGHNQVLDKLDSDYHAVINPDIIIEDDVLTQLAGVMRSDEEIGIITPKILNPDRTEQFLPKLDPKIKYSVIGRLNRKSKLRKEYTMRDRFITDPTEIEFCTGCFMLIKTPLFKVLNGFDERYFMYFEDADLSRKVRKANKIIFYPGCHVIHEWERTDTKSLKYFLIHLSSMFKYLYKWRK